MNVQQIVTITSAIFVLVILFLAGVLDVYFGGRYGSQATISFQVQTWCQRFPILYIALAWLLFHLTKLPCQDTIIEIKDGQVNITQPLEKKK